jgi:hypothetical protein
MSTSTKHASLFKRGSTTKRPISLNRRLSRLRCTAAPRTRAPVGEVLRRGFGTTTPRRECRTGEAETKTSRFRVFLLFPRRNSSRISSEAVIRAVRGRANPRPLAGVSPLFTARRGRGYCFPCLPPMVTTRRLRPRLRRAFRTLRPPRVAMRARNPCLLIRLRLRGRYVGFIGAIPGTSIHSKAQTAEYIGRAQNRQRSRDPPPFRADSAPLDFSTTPV